MGLWDRRPNSPYWWYRCEGYCDPKGNPLREATKVRIDAPTPEQRKENRRLAEQIYHDRMTALARADHELPSGKPRIRVGAFLDWFVKHELPKRRGREREAEIVTRWRAVFGALWLDEVDQTRVKEWMTARLTTPTQIGKQWRTQARVLPPPSTNTVNREVDVLKAVLQAAVPTYLESSPLFGMKRLRTVTPKRRILTGDEERRLLALMTVEDRAFFLVGEDTLTRLSDIIDLKTSDDHGTHLWIADPKTGGGFYVPVSKRLRRALDARPDDGRTYLFPKFRIAKTDRDRRNGVRQMLEHYCALAGIPFGRRQGGVTFHWATRRTGATRMLSAGSDVGTVQKVGRWKKPDVLLEIYHELMDDDARRAVESVGRRAGRRRPRASDHPDSRMKLCDRSVTGIDETRRNRSKPVH